MDFAKEKVVEEWFSASGTDLECAELLYNNKKFSQALYYLQQSNEKLAKGLLISFGILTPKRARKDLRLKSLNFSPKSPEFYGHRLMRSFLSDMDKLVPSLEDWYKLLEHGEWKPKAIEFQNTIRKSKKGIKKLKKRPFNLIESAEQLENEIKASQNILGVMDKTIEKINQEMDTLDFNEIVRFAITVVGRAGLKVDRQQVSSFNEIKEVIICSFRLSILVVVSVAMASFLDPLEAVTRYPDAQRRAFNEEDPYVSHFKSLHDLVALTLEKSQVRKMI